MEEHHYPEHTPEVHDCGDIDDSDEHFQKNDWAWSLLGKVIHDEFDVFEQELNDPKHPEEQELVSDAAEDPAVGVYFWGEDLDHDVYDDCERRAEDGDVLGNFEEGIARLVLVNCLLESVFSILVCLFVHRFDGQPESENEFYKHVEEDEQLYVTNEVK